jgi:hypothetical protein
LDDQDKYGARQNANSKRRREKYRRNAIHQTLETEQLDFSLESILNATKQSHRADAEQDDTRYQSLVKGALPIGHRSHPFGHICESNLNAEQPPDDAPEHDRRRNKQDVLRTKGHLQAEAERDQAKSLQSNLLQIRG